MLFFRIGNLGGGIGLGKTMNLVLEGLSWGCRRWLYIYVYNFGEGFGLEIFIFGSIEM